MSGTTLRLFGLVFVDEADILRKRASGIGIQAKTFDALLISKYPVHVPVAVDIDRIGFTPACLLVVGHCTGLAVDSVVPVQCGKDALLCILCFQSDGLIVSRLQIRVASCDVERIAVVGGGDQIVS